VAVHRLATSRSHKFSCTPALHYREVCLRLAAENTFVQDNLQPCRPPHGHFSSNQIIPSEPLILAYETFRRTRPYWPMIMRYPDFGSSQFQLRCLYSPASARNLHNTFQSPSNIASSGHHGYRASYQRLVIIFQAEC
jgi:hypothetical protein